MLCGSPHSNTHLLSSVSDSVTGFLPAVSGVFRSLFPLHSFEDGFVKFPDTSWGTLVASIRQGFKLRFREVRLTPEEKPSIDVCGVGRRPLDSEPMVDRRFLWGVSFLGP